MKKNDIGIKKNWQAEYENLQRHTQGIKSWAKKAEYISFYKRAAKAADQRLNELERLSKKEGYKEVTEWAYRKAISDIHAMFGSNAKRFNRKLPNNMNSIYKDISRVLDFLNAPTSSKSGIDEVYDKRANTINERYGQYGLDLNWSSTGTLFESILWKKVNSKYGSKTALKAIGAIQGTKKHVLHELKNNKPIRVIIPEDEKGNKDINVQDTVNKLLRYYKKDLSSLLKKI